MHFDDRNMPILLIKQSSCKKYYYALIKYFHFYFHMYMYGMYSSKSHIDLNRIKAQESLAIYIVNDANTVSLREEADSVFLSAISISR